MQTLGRRLPREARPAVAMMLFFFLHLAGKRSLTATAHDHHKIIWSTQFRPDSRFWWWGWGQGDGRPVIRLGCSQKIR